MGNPEVGNPDIYRMLSLFVERAGGGEESTPVGPFDVGESLFTLFDFSSLLELFFPLFGVCLLSAGISGDVRVIFPT